MRISARFHRRGLCGVWKTKKSRSGKIANSLDFAKKKVGYLSQNQNNANAHSGTRTNSHVRYDARKNTRENVVRAAKRKYASVDRGDRPVGWWR